MAKRINGAALRQLGTLFNVGVVREATDGQLLERFADGHGEAAELAFAALVERHGPMVLRVCRSILRDEHDAQDAFQATFLVLVRKARRLWVRDSLGPWLHQVACRAASGARSARCRRTAHERRAAGRTPERRAVEGDGEDLGDVLYEEIERLPGRYRAVIVLCDLEGRTHEQAARHLGCPAGTVKSRLSRGRQRLRERLARRGLVPLVGAALGAGRARGAVPLALAESATRAAMHVAAGKAAVGAVPITVIILTEGVLRTMFLNKLKVGLAALLAIGTITAGAGVLAKQGTVPRQRADRAGQEQEGDSGNRPARDASDPIETGQGEAPESFDQLWRELELILERDHLMVELRSQGEMGSGARLRIVLGLRDAVQLDEARPVLELMHKLGPIEKVLAYRPGAVEPADLPILVPDGGAQGAPRRTTPDDYPRRTTPEDYELERRLREVERKLDQVLEKSKRAKD